MKDSCYYQHKKKRQLFYKRAGIELTIGHLKPDYHLGCNFYKGILGDVINVMLVIAAYNFKRVMEGVSDKQNQRSVPKGERFAEICFLRDNYLTF